MVRLITCVHTHYARDRKAEKEEEGKEQLTDNQFGVAFRDKGAREEANRGDEGQADQRDRDERA